MRRHFLSLLACLMVFAMSQSAFAQKGRAPIVLNEVKIVGRVQRPAAAQIVARIRPKIALAEIRRPFVSKIEEVVDKEPF